ncbi:MAG: glycosyltransferase family 4 protein, partial [Candidatus Helarchaeota archaeon]
MKILIYSEHLADKSLNKIHSEANSVWEICKRLAKYIELTILTKKNYVVEKIPQNIEIFNYSEIDLLKKVFSREFYLVHQLHQFALSPLYFLNYSPIPLVISGDIKGTPNSDLWVDYHFKNLKINKKFFEILLCKLLNLKRIPKNFNIIICRQKILYKKLISLHYSPEKIFYVPFGVDTSIFRPNIKPFNKYEKSILFVGSIAKFKGVIDLLNAFKKVQKEVNNANLVIIGTPKKGQEYLLEIIHSMINNGFNIHYLGFVKNILLPKYYNSIDIFCAPSHFEPFGRVNLEAMACGKPVISTNAGGLPDYIKPMKTGILVPPKQPQILAEKLIYLLQNENYAKKLGNNARKSVVNNYT